MKRLLALLMMIALLGAFAAAENTQPVRILGASSYCPPIDSYAAAGHSVERRDGTMKDIASAIASRDPNIDIFIFDSNAGLDQIKKQHYYYPLTDDSALMDKLNDLYPAFRSALMDNGNLVGWYIDAQPVGWCVLSTTLLEELELSAPATFEEFLDVSKVLLDGGYLGNDYLLLLDYPFTQSGMLTFYLEQFLILLNEWMGRLTSCVPNLPALPRKSRTPFPKH